MTATTETGWLIELYDTTNGNRYYSPRPDTPLIFNNDHANAIRFARRQDADRMITALSMEKLAHATEHQWG